MKPALPPSYVNTPVSIAYAEVDGALIVTMTRILGLCCSHDYERPLDGRTLQIAQDRSLDNVAACKCPPRTVVQAKRSRYSAWGILARSYFRFAQPLPGLVWGQSLEHLAFPLYVCQVSQPARICGAHLERATGAEGLESRRMMLFGQFIGAHHLLR